jgi:hypothetical protein
VLGLREKALQSRDDDVATFTEAGGLILDTRFLFWLQVDHEAGEISADEAKELLRTNTGRFAYEPRREIARKSRN